MSKDHNVINIANLIKQMEVDLSLLKDETYGLDARYVWESTRFKLHNYLERKLLSYGRSNTSPMRIHRMSCITFVCFCFRYLYSIIVKNWLWAPRGRNWLIIQHRERRKSPINGKYEEIYTESLIDEIGIENCVIVEKPYLRQHHALTAHPVFHMEFLFLFSRIISLLLPLFLKYDQASINNMICDIKKYLDDKIKQNDFDIDNLFKVKSLFVNYMCYLFMLKRLKPKNVLFVTSNHHAALIKAAAVLHIPIVEVQHGVITPEHPIYYVPTGLTKRIFPDYLLLFGNFWKESSVNYSLPAERLIILGYPYFENMALKNQTVINKESQVLVISQGTIGEQLSRFAVKLAAINRGIKVIYKLHPGEYGRAQTIYPELYEARDQGLLEIVDAHTPSLYDLFSQSRWQIGVYSTALFEGIALGCQLILVDLPGIEYMTPLLEKGYAQVVKTPEEVQFQENGNFAALREELFASDWRSNWHKFAQMNLQCRQL